MPDIIENDIKGGVDVENQQVGRFAPTPSGRMHLGNLFSALIAWLSARACGGQLVLRMEDLDQDRCRAEYARQLEEDLLFLGLDWDEGGSPGGKYGPYVQQKRTQLYQEQLEKLIEQGLVYPCFCTRAELHAAEAPHASDGESVYSGRCRALSSDEIKTRSVYRSPALRLRVPQETICFDDGHYGRFCQNLADECGDFILRRSDGLFAYQLAVVADDAAMGVTQVVRGRDLLSSTPRQLYLYRLLGLEPPKFYHVPLLLSADGRRLSKREQDMGLDKLLSRGFKAPELIGRLAYLAGLLDRPVPAAARELVPLFSWDKIVTEDIYLPSGLFEAP